MFLYGPAFGGPPLPPEMVMVPICICKLYIYVRSVYYIYIHMRVYTFVVCVCANVYGMYMYVYTHMSMSLSPPVDVMGGWWYGTKKKKKYIHIYIYIYLFIYLCIFIHIYIYIYIVYINVDNMVFIYRSHQMVMPISALPKSLVSIVRNLRIHFEKRCVEWLGRASKTWVSQGGVRRTPLLQITVPWISSGSSSIMPPGVSSSYAFCVKAISVSFA